ncbi:hypothetical protein KIN20_006391 [Parelaphostrongylus tenuis]|uniref:Uncharacterized protein n=1 Tax=Parelaphostrongylus tenuis TaxID=148309 RepID=A0AAD5M4P3_PARTN|nr:hypothetical protein KIN20_006391 [Parelaphostrongylus tenuis]
MVAYTGADSIPIEAPGIATSKEAAKGFVERLVMQTVFDVLSKVVALSPRYDNLGYFGTA